MSSTKNLKDYLKTINQMWINDDNEVVKLIAEEVASLICNLPEHLNKDETNELPQELLSLVEKLDNDDDNNNDLKESINLLKWLPFEELEDHQSYQTAMIVGNDKNTSLIQSNKIHFGLIYLGAGMKFPECGFEGYEVFQNIYGPEMQIGKSHFDNLSPLALNSKVVYLPSEPHCYKMSNEGPNIGLFGRKLNTSSDKFWFFNLKQGESYAKDIMKIDDVKSYYDKFGNDYTDVMKSWGYYLPNAVFKAITQNLGTKSNDIKILDLGCGDGLIGLEFNKNQFSADIVGFDFSQGMLDTAKSRNVYSSLIKGDLMEKLPIKDNSFDISICISVTTYLKSFVLDEWIRVVKPGGLICFSHKMTVWPEWELYQKELEKNGKWEKIWVTNPPLTFLPLLKEGEKKTPCKELAKIYVYKKI